LPGGQARPARPRAAPPGAAARRADDPRGARARPRRRGCAASGQPGRRRVSDAKPRYAIAIGRFYEDLADRLIAGAQRAFVEGTGEAAHGYAGRGAFDPPLAAASLAETGRYSGVACLG